MCKRKICKFNISKPVQSDKQLFNYNYKSIPQVHISCKKVDLQHYIAQWHACFDDISDIHLSPAELTVEYHLIYLLILLGYLIKRSYI